MSEKDAQLEDDEARLDAVEPLRLAVASTNPVKIEAARLGASRLLPERPLVVDGRAVPSGVADQPMTDEETLRGAANRVEALAAMEPGADLWIGLEGGLQPRRPEARAGDAGPTLEAFGWCVVRDAAGRVGRSRTATFELPDEVARLVLGADGDPVELGDAVDRLAGTRGLKHRGGAVGMLSGGALTRTELYAPAVLLALVALGSLDG